MNRTSQHRSSSSWRRPSGLFSINAPLLRVLLTIVVASVVTGCRNTQENNESESKAEELQPLSLGPALTRADRVVTLAPSLTDVVLALGAADRLVGVTRFDDAPQVADLPRVGGYSDPSAEAILRLEPDVVLCQPSPGNRGAVELLAREGIAVHVLPLQTLDDIEAAYRSIGALLDLDSRATDLITELAAARKRASLAAERRSHQPDVIMLYGTEPLVASGPGSYGDDLIRAAGGRNLLEGSTQAWPRLSVEWLAARAPDAVLFAGLGAHGTGSEVLPGGLDLPTVILDSPGFMRPGPGVVEALDELTRVLDALSETEG